MMRLVISLFYGQQEYREFEVAIGHTWLGHVLWLKAQSNHQGSFPYSLVFGGRHLCVVIVGHKAYGLLRRAELAAFLLRTMETAEKEYPNV